jgi:pantothenate kinase
MALRIMPVDNSPEAAQTAFRIPSFDHAVQDPVEGDIPIPSSTKIVIVEGNYTLLDEETWNEIARLADEKYAALSSSDIP